MTDISKKLKELRTAHGLSQEKLAEHIAVSRQAVSKWENGEAMPDIENMIALAKLYNISLDELVGLTKSSAEPAPGNDVSNKKILNPKNTSTKLLRSIPYPIVITVIFLLLGILADAWYIAWILYVTIPIYYTILDCIDQKRISPFSYPVFVTCIFLFLGMQFGIWHPAWVIFITIPMFYTIAHEIDKKLGNQREDN